MTSPVSVSCFDEFRVVHFEILLSANCKFYTSHRLLEWKPGSMSIKLFKESMTAVRVSVEEGGEEDVFPSDEEPHFLKPDQGFGYNPLKLGERLQGSEIIGGT